jgi:hypothetical protein
VGLGNEQMGNLDSVGLLMRASMPSVQMAQRLGRPIEHGDYHLQPDGSPMPARDFMVSVFRRMHPGRVIEAVSEVPVAARIDAGRWLADCPMGCGGAEMVSAADPVFLCVSCGSGDKWWPVSFPTNRKAIETELVKRVDVHGWSWTPGETLAELRAETSRLNEVV